MFSLLASSDDDGDDVAAALFVDFAFDDRLVDLDGGDDEDDAAAAAAAAASAAALAASWPRMDLTALAASSSSRI